MGLNLRKTIVDFLKARPEERFTARQIGQWVFENLRDACEEKRTQSKQDLANDDDFLMQLTAEISSNRPDIQRRHPEIKTTESRPRRYFYSTASADTEEAIVERSEVSSEQAVETTSRLSEQGLYPLLAKYLGGNPWGT